MKHMHILTGTESKLNGFEGQFKVTMHAISLGEICTSLKMPRPQISLLDFVINPVMCWRRGNLVL